MAATGPDSGTACDWTISDRDCGFCATKTNDAVARMPWVSGAEIGIVSERLRLTLDETKTGRDKVEKTVRALGHGIAPRSAATKKDFALPAGAAAPRKDHRDHHAGHDHSGHDHEGHDHGPKKAAVVTRDDSGHGSPGHVHDDPADRGKRW